MDPRSFPGKAGIPGENVPSKGHLGTLPFPLGSSVFPRGKWAHLRMVLRVSITITVTVTVVVTVTVTITVTVTAVQ